ncbi:MAG: sulfur carrier protein ThiS [Acidobacteriota bacterium]
MTLLVNGAPRETDAGTTLREFLEGLGLSPSRVAVERNGTVVPRADLDSVFLEEGDRLEVVQLVGGG